MNKDALKERLIEARKRRGFDSAAKAAEAMGVKYPTYSDHERFGNIPLRPLARYAKFYGVSVEWLLHGKGGGEPASAAEFAQLTIPLKQIPFYRIDDLTIFTRIRNSEDIDECSEYLAVPSDTPSTAFAVRLTDKSMVQPVIGSLEPGTVVVIDPAASPEPGDLAFAIVKGFGAMVRRFGRAFDHGISYVVLTPANPAFETIKFAPDDESFISGRVISSTVFY